MVVRNENNKKYPVYLGTIFLKFTPNSNFIKIIRKEIDMLDIKDIGLMNITKVKPWAIYFDYNSEKYLLHGSTEGYESAVHLYRRSWNGKKYDLECISGYLSCSDNVENEFIKYKCKGKTYSQIDLERFICLLEYKKLCKGCCSMKVGQHQYLIKKNNEKITKLQKEIDELRYKNSKLAEFL